MYSKKSDRIFMTGTQGLQDYLVVSTKGGLALGIKAVLDEQPYSQNLYVGVRVRVANLPSSDTPVVNVAAKVEELYPDVPWTKKDNLRCSFFAGTKGPKPPSVEVTLKAMEEHQVFEKILESIKEHLEKHLTLITMAEVSEWFLETMKANCYVVFGEEIPTNKEGDTAEVLSEAKILPFNGKVEDLNPKPLKDKVAAALVQLGSEDSEAATDSDSEDSE